MRDASGWAVRGMVGVEHICCAACVCAAKCIAACLFLLGTDLNGNMLIAGLQD